MKGLAHPRGFEPLSTEPESAILSIELRTLCRKNTIFSGMFIAHTPISLDLR